MSESAGSLRHVSDAHPEEVIPGSVNQAWLDEVSPWLPRENPPAVTVLPDRVVDGKAIFGADIAPLVKQIRSQGFEAQFLPTPAQTFRSEYGADSLIALSFLLNVASNAAWDSFKLMLHIIQLRIQGARESGAEPKLTLTQGIFRYPDGSSYLWQKFSGSPEHVIELAGSTAREYMSANPANESRAVEPGDEAGESPWIAPA
jgi:hypothetical protein